VPHVHNALHHFTAYQSAFRKAVGEADAGFSGIERAGETLTPILDLWRWPEWAVLRGEILFSAQSDVAAVALERSFVGVRNPAGSGLIVIVESMLAIPTTAVFEQLEVFHGAIIATDVDGSEQVAPRDTRLPLAGVSRIVQIHGTGVAAIGSTSFTRWGTIINEVSRDHTVHVLTPGFELRCYHATANTALNLNIYGRIRPALDGELG
jgi:hypothetical protein